MSRESLSRAVKIAGGQSALVKAARKFLPEKCRLSQASIAQWLNPEKVKCDVPPPEFVIPFARALNWQITPHELRPDIYPNQNDALPAREKKRAA